ncbi:hypothetical protein MASR2M54_03200 [Aliarcobacter cryaerophilus]
MEKINNFFNSRKVYTDEELAKFLNKTSEETFEILHEYSDFRLANKIKDCIEEKGNVNFMQRFNFLKYSINYKIKQIIKL